MKKVKYLKIDRGRYYFQRRVPDQFRELLGFSKWQTPCGPVSYTKAVQLVVNWAEGHDDLLASLRTNDGFDRVEASVLRTEDEAHKAYFKSLVDDAGFTILDATDDQGEPVKPRQHALIRHGRRVGKGHRCGNPECCDSTEACFISTY